MGTSTIGRILCKLERANSKLDAQAPEHLSIERDTELESGIETVTRSLSKSNASIHIKKCIAQIFLSLNKLMPVFGFG